MSNTVEVKGAEEIAEKLNGVLDAETMEQNLKKICALVERAAKQKAPKGNGELRRSITSRTEGELAIIFTTLEYAPYVEYGTGLFAEEGGRQDVPWHYQDDEGEWHTTSGMPPHPFMRPALNENRAEIKRIIKGGLKK
jgi:HK97 gp10 family phage protein